MTRSLGRGRYLLAVSFGRCGRHEVLLLTRPPLLYDSIHMAFFLGSDCKMPAIPAVIVDGGLYSNPGPSLSCFLDDLGILVGVMVSPGKTSIFLGQV
jgi:hypothetical protein